MGMVTNATDKYQACIDACSKCTQACYECFTACLNESDLNARKNCVSILVECAMFKDAHCKKCADICNMCANECRKMASM
ncbi:four-helix bundle copper-binding protein [Marinisporobacter balticus]|uniref:Four-helix bundle copper-binding protein n=1 Tax=Marinisporobacter balticus TaxID=2018667 RepID=A0A4R2KPY4_9FIRM|nr:four-helix bundle copper-binding protein [Marinisporobacter balticus]TCO72158.1 hypothetical protein EV214_11921 [Marinisporobacter balticus]